MNWRLAAVLLGCLTLAACSPPTKGHVIVGKNNDGDLIAVIGFCKADREVSLAVSDHKPGGGLYFSTTHWKSTEVMRVTLRSGEVPDGWKTVDTLDLPAEGTLFLSARVADARSGWNRGGHKVHPTEVDLAAVPPLPDDADQQALEDC